jgi:hypothetical protein
LALILSGGVVVTPKGMDSDAMCNFVFKKNQPIESPLRTTVHFYS